ncbi:GGDEF domain-containing protein [Lacimicrobium sp. SS2-24]|uniref:GGDEF domain-containing protein n=1 Tax=Lacimicrobium sp. SS2-24 TaxID=2005569 RepID=UPI000B4BFFBA|nr:GGDEF domain-containing protein [Lacimicrobium sp. SS2-24]
MKDSVDINPFLLRSTLRKLRTTEQDALNGSQAQHDGLSCDAMLLRDIQSLEKAQLQRENQQLLLALKQARAELQQLMLNSQCDALTQTLNRSVMLDRIKQAIRIAKRERGLFALLFIDLDNFKPVNDRHGHGAGDKVLQQVSARLRSSIRESDAISRHGGDEFLLLLNNTKHKEDADQFAAKLCCLLAQPYQIDKTMVEVSASIGVATFPADGKSAEKLISVADAAMYQAKRRATPPL